MQFYYVATGYPRSRRRRRRRWSSDESMTGVSSLWAGFWLLSLVLVTIVRGDAGSSAAGAGKTESLETGALDGNGKTEPTGSVIKDAGQSRPPSSGMQSSAIAVIIASSETEQRSTTTSLTSKATTSSTASSSGAASGIASLSRSTCPSRTINYITHTLVQQCLKANRTTTAVNSSSDGARASQAQHDALEQEAAATSASGSPAEQATDSLSASFSASSTSTVDADTDSPLDNANFLSFEEWKKQNLARFEKAKENAARDDAVPNKVGGINNALESMSDGESFDVSLELGGSDSKTPMQKTDSPQSTQAGSNAEHSTPSERPRKKDAGTTCKERFNYASTDCAATILKTNAKCKSASSVLKENKDSYMLNECSIQNKFLIVELCDDILVDTIVLANFEFFSSMFRTFRISVSDRYPVELDRWKVLGTFEAKNAREVQPFAIHNPLIWARYLRVEFLSHYGAEYYCPVSLLRVHGTTMIDELRNPEEPSKVDEPEDATVAIPAPAPVAPDIPPDMVSSSSKAEAVESASTVQQNSKSLQTTSTSTQPIDYRTSSDRSGSASTDRAASQSSASAPSFPFIGPLLPSDMASQSAKTSSQHNETAESTASRSPATSQASSSNAMSSRHGASTSSKHITPSSSTLSSSATSSLASPPVINPSLNPPGSSETSQLRSGAPPSSQPPSKAPSSPAQPPIPSPTTQESFFKSFHKRLQVLEANAALSLQYMEEQSRILRDAFTKVEKRQKTKVDDFVFHLNTTVMAELRGFRQQYDQLWQSTVIELESHRDQYQREILSVSTRLSMLAEELVWQKRMALVQTTLLVICLTLFIFVRSSNGAQGQLEVPIMQQWLNKSHSMLGFPFDSPRPTSASSNKGKDGGMVGNGGATGQGSVGLGRRLMRVRSVDDLDEDSDEHQLLNSPSPAPMGPGATANAATNSTAHLRADHDAYDYESITPTRANFANGDSRTSLLSDDMEGASSPITDSETSSAPSSSIAASRLKAMVNDTYRSKPTHRPRMTRNPSSNDSLGTSWTTTTAGGSVGDEYAVRESSPLVQEVQPSIEEVDEGDYQDEDEEDDRDAYEDASDHGSSFNVSSPSVGYIDSPVISEGHATTSTTAAIFGAAHRHDTPLYDKDVIRT